MPSIVVTSAPSAWTASTVQDLTASPFRWHGARAAVGGVAADVRAGEAERVTQEVDQEQTGLDLGRLLGAVDRHRNADRAGHVAVSSSSTVGTCCAAYWVAGGEPTAVRFRGPCESFVPSGSSARAPFSSSGVATSFSDACVLPVVSMNALMMSSGSGNTTVEFCVAPISVSVCR